MKNFIKPVIIDRVDQLKFGTIDIETWSDPHSGQFIPYCAACYLDGKQFYAYTGEDYKARQQRRASVINDVILVLFYRIRDHMKLQGEKSVVLYAHNLSSFDGYFILTACANHGIDVDILKRGSEIFFVKFKLSGVSFELRCSLVLLRQGLNSCAKSFQVDLLKMPLDHEWVTQDKLFYEGPTRFSGGKSIFFPDYAKRYCMNDCVMLYEILSVFQAKINELGLSLSRNVYSIPGLAFRAFKQKHLEVGAVVNLSLCKSIEDFIREGYYGGRTEVFRSYIGGGNGYYYDVKGMYAQAMKKPLPYGRPRWQTSFDSDWLRDDMPKGFYKVSVVAPSMDIPVLPYRTSNGKLIFPIGEWEGTYYSDELLLAKDHGYTITPIEAVVFSESRDFLHKYVDEFTRVKELGGAYRPIGKLFINSLYGRFGFRQNNEVTVIIDNHMVNYYSNRYDIIDNVAIGKFTLLTYISKPVLQYYKDSNLFSEYAKDMRRFKREFRYTESNVALAAAITALGRIHLYNDICSVQKHGGQVAYCDTDSIYAYFTSSPLGQWHGGVYWDPDDPDTCFEEGVFLAPKMYSIKNRHTHIKGVKMDSVRHEVLLSCLKSKSPNLKVESTFQFVKRDYNIYLRGVNKVFTLWDDNKRVWYQDGDVWLTKPRVITSAVTAGDDSVVYHSTEKVDIPNDFSELNRFNPNSDGYQLIANDVEIKVYRSDIHITLLAHSHRWDLLYYCIMGKLALKYSPTFIKINVITQDKRVYTLTKYIYNPLVRFRHTYPSFMHWIVTAVDAFKIKYDITLPAHIQFILAYPPGIVTHLVGYDIIIPIPQSVKLRDELRGIKERVRVKNRLLTELDVVNKEIGTSEHHISADTQHNSLLLKLMSKMRGSTIINTVIASAEHRESILHSLARSLLDSKGSIRHPSLQDVMGHFLSNLPQRIYSLTQFMLYTKAGILLLRWLSSLDPNPITLERTGRYSPYIVDLPAEDASWIRDYYYSNKVFFDPSEYDPVKSGVVADIASLELTPIYLNHEYLKEVRAIFEDVKNGRLDRQTYGFSAIDETFEGEVLNLDESFTHYDYLVNTMGERGVECFYMYWYTDKRGRVYPSLTNFSIQSSRIIRLGFLFKPSVRNVVTLGDIHHLPEYKDYIVNLVTKYAHPTANSIDFDQAVDILRDFTISGSKKHYELLLRKLEVNRLLTQERVHIAPISIDGRCNVYQHISALTRDETLSALVYTTPMSSDKDIYTWFSDLLISDIKSRDDLMTVYHEFTNKEVDMRGLVKQAVMTFPYGSTEYTIRKDMSEYLRENYGEISWGVIVSLGKLVNQLRQTHLTQVQELSDLLHDIIMDCRAVRWTLPDDFKVNQTYFKGKDVTISTSVEGREMHTQMRFITDRVNYRAHKQAIVANFIHSLDAYHLRQVIRGLKAENIAMFPIHDCIVFDIDNIRVVRRIVADEFNQLYNKPEQLLLNFYSSIVEHNPNKDFANFDINQRINRVIGSGIIKAGLDLFQY